MNKRMYQIGLGVVVLLFGILFLPKIAERLQQEEVVDSSRTVAAEDVRVIDLHKMQPMPAFTLVDQHGDTITPADLKGKVTVVEFFFTTCPTICPIMKQNLKKVQEAFKDENRVAIVSISIRPQDTVEVLADYAQNYNITHPNWHLLTGNNEDIHRLAREGFFLYTEVNSDAPGGFEHSGKFAMFDKSGIQRSRYDDYGNPIGYYDGVEEEGTTNYGVLLFIEDMKKLLKERVDE